MGKLRVANFSLSIDGFGAGLNQSLENPIGINGIEVHKWFFATRTFQDLVGGSPNEGETGLDDNYALRAFRNVGAYIMGRNMFSPSRGQWANLDWEGWWGKNPPFHVPVFVLTHYGRPAIEMDGGTTFYFVTDGIESALDKARRAAGEKDVGLGGGVATIREYLKSGHIDELHLVITPVLLGKGEHLLEGIDLLELGYACVEFASSQNATHVILQKKNI